MDSQPLVSIICLCYNQKKYVGAAIRSALAQTYANIELIVVDDGSTDGSNEEIRNELAGTTVEFIDLPENIGNCAAFNKGLARSTGEFIIDLAADDLLLPLRLEIGIQDFDEAGPKAGVHFSDALIIDESAQPLGTHYRRNKDGKIEGHVPVGDVYIDLIGKYYICPPTMMSRRAVYESLGGYDEALEYEDFDFWMRSSRDFEYIFNPTPLMKYRKVQGSLGASQRVIRNKHTNSTLKVCQKIAQLNRSIEEDEELRKRCWYEIRQCLRTLNLEPINNYFSLIKTIQRRTF
jgi:glycosyltransferase involved in cell wall biosynthesis